MDEKTDLGPASKSSQVTKKAKLILTVSEDENKLSKADLVPLWQKGSTEAEKYRLLERYVDDMKYVKSMNIFSNERTLIYASLNKSNRTALMDVIPTEALSTVTLYLEYIEKAFGRPLLEVKKQLSELKKLDNESPHAFLTRIVKLYYKSLGYKEAKTLNEIDQLDNHSAEKIDLVFYYLNGYNRPAVVRELKLRRNSITKVTQLADKSVDIERVLDSEKAINMVFAEEDEDEQNQQRSNNEDFSDEEESDNEEVNNVECEHCNPTYRNRRVCWVCGRSNHLARDCRFRHQ